MRSIWIFLTIIFSLFSTTSSKCQESPWDENSNMLLDSIMNDVQNLEKDSAKVDLILKASWKLMRNNPKISLALNDSLDLLYQNAQGFDYKKTTRIYYRGIAFKNLGNTIKAEKQLKRYTDLMIEKGQNRRAMAGMQALGNLYTNLNLYDKAIELYTGVLESNKQEADSLTQGRILTRLGYFLSKVDKYEEALNYNKKALDYLANHRSSKTYINTLNDRGIIYEYMEKWDSMLHYYNLNLVLSQEFGDKSNLVYAHYNLATGYQKLEQLDKAQYHFDQCREFALESSNKVMLMFTYIGLADVAYTQNRLRDGLKWLSKMDDEDFGFDILHDQEELRSKIYGKLGNYRQAYQSLEKSKIAGDSLSEQTSKSRIVAIESKYDRKQKELEILTLNAQKQAAELATVRANRRSIYLFSGLLISLLITGSILYFYYLKRKTNRQLSEKNEIISSALYEKEILLKEIHHRVKNNLQMVSSLLSLQSMSQENESASQALEEGQRRVQSMALIHQHLYSGENVTSVNMKEYLEHLCMDIFASHNMEDGNIELDLNISEIDLDIGTVVPLGLIFNELITNACKYAFPNQMKGKVMVSLREKDNLLIAEVSDNGIGQSSNRTGFGSRLIDIFSNKMKAERVKRVEDGVSNTFLIKNYKRA